MPPEIEIITNRLERVERENANQSTALGEAVLLLRKIDLALRGDPSIGIIGAIESNRALNNKLSAVDLRLESVENKMEQEKWVGRIGAGVVGSTGTALMIWLKVKLFGP